tara:strand:+ start:201 stop:1139 length:939 start_codon:yes stop_codon:yes gene_type:complete
MKKNDKIFIAGHKGFLGSALVNQLKLNNFNNLILRTKKQLDLIDHLQVERFFKRNRPDIVINAAGNSGNLYQCIKSPAKLYYINSTIQNNLFEISKKYSVKKLAYISSSCIYPDGINRPIKETDFLNGKLELATEGYAASKISGILACKSYNKQYFNNKPKFIALVPNTLFGPNDNFNLEEAHVFSALIKRFSDAQTKNKKYVKILGSGESKREFILNYNVADAIIFMLKNSSKLKNYHYNIGPGKELSIRSLANLLSKKLKYKGKIVWDTSKHNGRKRKLLSYKEIEKIGWKPKYNFQESLELTINWYNNK